MIDMERLIDVVTEYQNNRNTYYNTVNKPYSAFEGYSARRDALHRATKSETQSWYELTTVEEVLCMDTEARDRLWIVGKAISRWREDTNYEKLIPSELQDRLRKFIFQEVA